MANHSPYILMIKKPLVPQISVAKFPFQNPTWVSLQIIFPFLTFIEFNLDGSPDEGWCFGVQKQRKRGSVTRFPIVGVIQGQISYSFWGRPFVNSDEGW